MCFSANTESKVAKVDLICPFYSLLLFRLIGPNLHLTVVIALILYQLALAQDIQACIKLFIVRFIVSILTQNPDTYLVYVTAAPPLQPLPLLIFPPCPHTPEGLYFSADSLWWLLLHVSFSVPCICIVIQYCHSW